MANPITPEWLLAQGWCEDPENQRFYPPLWSGDPPQSEQDPVVWGHVYLVWVFRTANRDPQKRRWYLHFRDHYLNRWATQEHVEALLRVIGVSDEDIQCNMEGCP